MGTAADEPVVDALVQMLAAVPVEVCRAPSPDGAPWEAALAAADAVAVRSSMSALIGRVPELPDLLEAAWAAPARVAPAAGRLLAGVDVLAVADELLAGQHVPASRVFVDQDGTGLPGALAMDDLEFMVERPSTTALAALLREGGGVVVVGVEEHDPVLNRAAEDLDRVLGLASRIDVEWSGPNGLAVAADGYGRLLVPIRGRVVVEARAPMVPPGVEAPMPSSTGVDPGDGVHLPPGWGHRLVPVDGDAVVAAVLLPRLTAKSLAMQMVDDLPFWPLFRSDLPLDRHAPHASYAGSVYEGAGLGANTAAVVDTDMAGRLAARNRARLGARWTAGMIASLAAVTAGGPDTAVRVPLPGGLMVDQSSTADDAVLFGGRRRFRMDAAAAAALGVLADGATHRLEELIGLAPVADGPAWATALGRDLLRVGIAEVVV